MYPTTPSGATGRTRCPGCDRRFTDTAARTARPTTTIRGTERRGGRPGYSANGPHGHDVTIDIRWHVDCLADFEATNAKRRDQARQGRRDAVEQIARSYGLDVGAALAEFDARNPVAPPGV